MHFINLLLTFGSLILGSSYAQWTMNFFDGGACNGDELGQLTLDLEEANCLNNFAYNATGVIVNTTNPGGQAIAFYQTSDCDKEYQVALSNTPFCVGTIYGSFKVVNSYDDSSGTDLNAAYFQGNFGGTQTVPVATPSTTLTIHTSLLDGILPATADSPMSTGVVSLGPRGFATSTSTPTKRDLLSSLKIGHDDSLGDPEIYHGITRVFGDETFKMHQIARGVYTGVKIDEWDDIIHARDDTELDFTGEDPFFDFSEEHVEDLGDSSDISLLEPRLFKYATCSVLTQCVYTVSSKVLFGVFDGVELLFKGIKSIKNLKRDQVFRFLNTPYAVQIVGGIPAGVFSGWIVAKTSFSASPVSQCSDKESDLDVLKSAFLGLHGAHIRKTEGNISDITLSFILPDGTEAKISVNARVSYDTTPEVCGAGVKAGGAGAKAGT